MISTTLRIVYATAVLALVATGLASAKVEQGPTFAVKNPTISSLGFQPGDVLR